jgi:hypothetical protein
LIAIFPLEVLHEYFSAALGFIVYASEEMSKSIVGQLGEIGRYSVAERSVSTHVLIYDLGSQGHFDSFNGVEYGQA